MLKIFLSFGPRSARLFYGSSSRRSKYFIKALEMRNYPVCLTNGYRTSVSSKNLRKFFKNKNKSKTEVNENELSQVFNVDELKRDFSVPLERFKDALLSQTQKPKTKDLIESFSFEYNGKTYQIRDLARVGKKSPSLYILHFEEAPRCLPSALEAIQKATFKCHVSLEGTKLHVHVPHRNKAERDFLKKMCKTFLARCKDDLYLIENLYIRNLKKQDNLDFEFKFRLEDQLRTLAQQKVKEAEKILGEQLVELQRED